MSATTEPPSRREWVVAAAVLGGAQVLLLGRVLFLDAALHGRDVLHHYWPLHEAVRRALEAGHLPAWDAGVQGGMPLLGNPHAGVFYPPNLLFQLLEFPRAYAWLVAAHALGLGLGAWALFRRWVGPPAALAGALTITLCGPVVSLNPYGPLLASLCWTPWALWVQLSGWHWTRRLAATGGLLALQVTAGDPMPALFTGLSSLLALATFRRERGALGVLAGGYALGGLLSAVQALPALEVLRHSARAGGAGGGWNLHPARALELVLPDVFGHYLEEPMFWGNFLSDGPVLIPFLLSAYLGSAALVGVLFGAGRNRVVAFGAAALALGLGLALGARGPLGPVVQQVPPFSLFRYPEKYLLLSSLGWSALVGAGVEWAAAGQRRPGRMIVAALPAVLALLALAGSGPLRPWLEGWVAPDLERIRLPAQVAVESVREAAVSTLAFSLLALAVFAARKRLQPGWAPWLVVGVVGLDLWLAAQRTVWTGPLGLYRERPPLAEQLSAASPHQPFRYFRDNARLERWVQSTGTYEGMAERRTFDALTLKTGVGAVWGLEDLGSPSPVVLPRWRALTGLPGVEKARALAAYNACAVIAARDTPLVQSGALERLAELPLGVAVFALPGCVPRLHFAARVHRAGSMDEALAAFRAPGFTPGVDAVVEAPQPLPAAAARLLAVELEPNGGVRARVEAAQGGLLVYSASFFPGWEASVDGRPAELFPANVALIGVAVPPGAEEVAVRFRPRGVVAGGWLSALGLAILATLWGVRRLPGMVKRLR